MSKHKTKHNTKLKTKHRDLPLGKTNCQKPDYMLAVACTTISAILVGILILLAALYPKLLAVIFTIISILSFVGIIAFTLYDMITENCEYDE